MKTKLVVLVLGLSLLMIIFSGVKLNQAYNAGPTIYYDGQKKEFVYFNVEGNDTFNNFKEMMPGDRREQEITFKADNIKRDTKIFLNISRSFDENIINYIKIYVGNKELLKSKENIEIANFLKDEEIKLKVVVEIPKEAGNDIADLEYNMEWEILVQEGNGELVKIPNTYDDTNVTLYISICIISLILMIYSIVKLKSLNK